MSKRRVAGPKNAFLKLFSPHSQQLPRASHVGHAESWPLPRKLGHGSCEFRIAAQLRHLWLCFATWITWICRSSTAVELKRRSVRWSLESCDLPVRVCFWRRVILCRARPPPSPTGHIHVPSPVHFAERQSPVSAGYCHHRLAWLALQAQAAPWVMGGQLSPVVPGACGPVFAKVRAPRHDSPSMTHRG